MHIFVWVLACISTAFTIFMSTRSNFNMGILILWTVSLALLSFAIFFAPLCAFFSHGIGKLLKWFLICGFAFFASLFSFVAVSGYPGTATNEEAAIIILGAGLRGEKVNDVLRRRLEAGLEAWKLNPNAYLVVSGGQGLQESIPEALAMKNWLLARGVPKDKIIAEDKSTSTRENLRFSAQLLKEKGIEQNAPIALVTNAFHCYRAKGYAKMEAYTNIRHIPSSMSPLAIPQSYAREVFAVLYYWVFSR